MLNNQRKHSIEKKVVADLQDRGKLTNASYVLRFDFL